MSRLCASVDSRHTHRVSGETHTSEAHCSLPLHSSGPPLCATVTLVCMRSNQAHRRGSQAQRSRNAALRHRLQTHTHLVVSGEGSWQHRDVSLGRVQRAQTICPGDGPFHTAAAREPCQRPLIRCTFAHASRLIQNCVSL